MILLDTSGVLAAIDLSQRHHRAAAAALAAAPPPRLLSPFVLAELDYLLIRELGIEFELSVLREVAAGAYTLAPFDEDAVGEAEAVARRYADLRIGLADASAVVLAGRYGTNRILTLDERHFRALRAPRGRRFRVLPADAD